MNDTFIFSLVHNNMKESIVLRPDIPEHCCSLKSPLCSQFPISSTVSTNIFPVAVQSSLITDDFHQDNSSTKMREFVKMIYYVVERS